MPWKECHVMDERLRFVARLLEGVAVPVFWTSQRPNHAASRVSARRTSAGVR